MSEREPYTSAYRRAVPPWLQRSVGARLMESLAAQVDTLVERTTDGVLLRFPGLLQPVDENALAFTGRERRIRRGPFESPSRYARRLRGWWAAHRTRGGPYALLEQLRAYLGEFLTVRTDVVYYSGTRRWQDVDGTITRDAVTWSASGPSEGWAHVWVFLYVPETIPIRESTMLDESGDPILADDGSEILGVESVVPGSLTPEEAEIFLAIPREWSAAHIRTIRVVLLYSTARLWNYPQPVPTWSAWGASGATWGGPTPVILSTEAV